MDFLDSALDVAKETFEIVSKKTEEVVTTSKQKFNIASLKNKRSKNFERLGEIFYEELRDSDIEDEEIKALVKLVTKQCKDIARLEKELEDAQNRA